MEDPKETPYGQSYGKWHPDHDFGVLKVRSAKEDKKDRFENVVLIPIHQFCWSVGNSALCATICNLYLQKVTFYYRLQLGPRASKPNYLFTTNMDGKKEGRPTLKIHDDVVRLIYDEVKDVLAAEKESFLWFLDVDVLADVIQTYAAEKDQMADLLLPFAEMYIAVRSNPALSEVIREIHVAASKRGPTASGPYPPSDGEKMVGWCNYPIHPLEGLPPKGISFAMPMFDRECEQYFPVDMGLWYPSKGASTKRKTKKKHENGGESNVVPAPVSLATKKRKRLEMTAATAAANTLPQRTLSQSTILTTPPILPLPLPPPPQERTPSFTQESGGTSSSNTFTPIQQPRPQRSERVGASLQRIPARTATPAPSTSIMVPVDHLNDIGSIIYAGYPPIPIHRYPTHLEVPVTGLKCPIHAAYTTEDVQFIISEFNKNPATVALVFSRTLRPWTLWDHGVFVFFLHIIQSHFSTWEANAASCINYSPSFDPMLQAMNTLRNKGEVAAHRCEELELKLATQEDQKALLDAKDALQAKCELLEKTLVDQEKELKTANERLKSKVERQRIRMAEIRQSIAAMEDDVPSHANPVSSGSITDVQFKKK